jgi:mannose/fructose/N-acetylgalactosamine-specific phosphotransferase system component IIC
MILAVSGVAVIGVAVVGAFVLLVLLLRMEGRDQARQEAAEAKQKRG